MITSKAAFTEVRIYAYAQKNTDMRLKNTHIRVKFLLCWFVLYCLLPNMRIYACVFPHAFFLRLTKNKIRTRYAHFSGIYKERLVSVVVMLLAFETFNLGSVLTKI